MRIGFTGTRKGMTAMQKASVESWLTIFGFDWFHHGDCVGADAEAHKIAVSLGYEIEIYPSTIKNKRAYCEGQIVREPRHPLKRNHDIVNDVYIMIAAPKGYQEIKRGSGTWATIRYARKKKTGLFIVYPDGKTEERP